MLQTLEELAMNAWPAPQTVFEDGWVLRFAGGYTRRANSILPLYPGSGNVIEKIARCEQVYQERGLPVIFKLVGRAESRALDTVLAGCGYKMEAETLVQWADLSAATRFIDPALCFSTHEDAAWEEAFRGMSGLTAEQQALHRQILMGIVPKKCFAGVVVDGALVGCALGVVQSGFLGIFDVLIHPSFRRLGYGERLMRGLMDWAQQQGATKAYLQVMQNNAAAQRLYARLEFQNVYEYWYRVKAAA